MISGAVMGAIVKCCEQRLTWALGSAQGKKDGIWVLTKGCQPDLRGKEALEVDPKPPAAGIVPFSCQTLRWLLN